MGKSSQRPPFVVDLAQHIRAPTGLSSLRLSNYGQSEEAMRADEIMSIDVVTVSPETHIRDVARKLLERGVSALPVVDDGGAHPRKHQRGRPDAPAGYRHLAPT